MTPAFPSYHRCKYEGQYRKGQMHGRGSYLYANGAEYSGYFSQGWEEGPGTYTLHGKRERERERERERKKEREKERVHICPIPPIPSIPPIYDELYSFRIYAVIRNIKSKAFYSPRLLHLPPTPLSYTPLLNP